MLLGIQRSIHMKKSLMLLSSLLLLSPYSLEVNAQSEAETTYTQMIEQLNDLETESETNDLDKYTKISSIIALIDDGIENIEQIDESIQEKEQWIQSLKSEALIMIEGIITQPDTTETSEQSADTNSTQTTNSQDVPQEYKNALAKAESYVSMMAMSKMGVYDQLTSEYGEGFPEDAAQYAIDNLDFDWNEVALEKAKSYYESMNMSKSGVYDQLVSEYGEQFTPQEAQYAIDNLD